LTPPSSLADGFASLTDPRSPLGRRHPLPAVLSLVTVAVLCGARSLEAIAQFARDRGRAFTAALGFTRPDTPCKATLSNLLRRLDPAALEAALAAWIAARAGDGDGPVEVAIDGKALRGSADGAVPGVHLLAAYAPRLGGVLAQLRVEAKTNEHKAALEMLGALPLRGAVVTADAMFTHADFAAEVLDGGGDYLLPLKDNQPTLLADAALAFETPEALSPPAEAPAGGRPPVGPRGR
jgi:DDE_Tnp_1-associated/Transposase DDE domain